MSRGVTGRFWGSVRAIVRSLPTSAPATSLDDAGLIEQQRPDRDRQAAESRRHCSSRRVGELASCDPYGRASFAPVSGSLASLLLLDHWGSVWRQRGYAALSELALDGFRNASDAMRAESRTGGESHHPGSGLDRERIGACFRPSEAEGRSAARLVACQVDDADAI